MTAISVLSIAGSFAENKDRAREARVARLMPALARQEEVVIDFSGVEGATQSFVHALIADALRQYGPDALDKILFKGCNETIKKIIGIVTEYMQEI